MQKKISSKPPSSAQAPHGNAEKIQVSDAEKNEMIAQFLEGYQEREKDIPILWDIVEEILQQGLSDAAFGRLKRDHGTVDTFRIYNDILTLREACGADDSEIAGLLQDKRIADEFGDEFDDDPIAIKPEEAEEMRKELEEIMANGVPEEVAQEGEIPPADINEYVDRVRKNKAKEAALEAIAGMDPNDRITFIEVRDEHGQAFLDITRDLNILDNMLGCNDIEVVKRACLARLEGQEVDTDSLRPKQKEQPKKEGIRSRIRRFFGA